MNSEPQVSVVMATFNRPQYLAAAIDSVLAQSLGNLELIIADDGSGEETRRLLRSRAADPRVRLLTLSHTGRPSQVRNHALAHARAPWVAFQDSDDLWERDKLASQCAALAATSGARWSYTACTHVDAQGREIHPPGVAAWRPHQGRILDAVACLRAHAALPTVMIARSLLVETGGFDPDLALFEDHDLWLRVASRAEVAVEETPRVKVRRHAEHYSGHLPLDTAECRAVFLERAWRCALTNAARSELRRIRALNAAHLARLRASAGDSRAARLSLRASADTGWRYIRWWLDAALALATPARRMADPGTTEP